MASNAAPSPPLARSATLQLSGRRSSRDRIEAILEVSSCQIEPGTACVPARACMGRQHLRALAFLFFPHTFPIVSARVGRTFFL
ncbi:uncharacterized protein P884DRAFT_39251 [Thermothelomyces heterothallicus CBS 202.75]|uniref:uncharacterized protein n=1 Tax=Thermothelomyces heterothallicus CBS 202.75 TaxID=1149848 RepID=UPI0037444A0B